jgi:predicted RNA-binding Zn-ribbon protein involved in translation (DUF1610 family)
MSHHINKVISFKEKIAKFYKQYGYCSNCHQIIAKNSDDKCPKCGMVKIRIDFPNKTITVKAYNNYNKNLFWI